MTAPASIDLRIVALVPEVAEDFRTELQQILRTLRDAGNPLGAVTALSRPSLRLVSAVVECAGHQRPSDNLYDCLVRAAGGGQLGVRRSP
jgi:hypothetical protein